MDPSNNSQAWTNTIQGYHSPDSSKLHNFFWNQRRNKRELFTRINRHQVTPELRDEF